MCADDHSPKLPRDDVVARAAASLRLLADPTRIKVLLLLRDGETAVSELAGRAGASPTAVSQHLAKLRLAGLVSARRRGSNVLYSLADGHVSALLADVVDHAGHPPANPPAPPAPVAPGVRP